ncbi:hypothetical protein B0T24DRAFT_668799 [Lasiosphaeria ovina]|uniref:GA4 desaturase n=1 Tax=Lasiosphaeria ovina TaxID=92902 RepID=A0AAE0N395_9PEZI|nr:hypothetical protein B0T24DRAFT_668799 [Lasiosphaeria ovina]
MILDADLAIKDTARQIQANLNYLLPNGPSINRGFVSAGIERNTGRYGPFPTMIRDGRTIRPHFSLDRHGFELLDAPTSVANFANSAAIERALDASLVVPTSWMLRTSGAIPPREKQEPYRHYGGLQPATGEVHVDTEPSRQAAYAQRMYAQVRPEGKGFKRFVISSIWRTFSPPPQDYPLAVCDTRSVRKDEGTPNVLWVVDQMPDDLLDPAIGDDNAQPLAAAIFRHSPDHRWWYFSRMARDEVLLFKFHDSDRSVGWRVPHSAFWDGSLEGANTRESIECRTIAFFE